MIDCTTQSTLIPAQRYSGLCLSLHEARSHNIAAAIHRLPNELISEIFFHGWQSVPNEYKPRQLYLTILSSVCSHWRSLIVFDPRLWTTIHLSDSISSLQSVPRPLSLRDEEQLAESIRRSGIMPLEVKVNVGCTGSDEDFDEENEIITCLRRCVRMIRKETHRCEIVDITAPLHSLTRPRSLQGDVEEDESNSHNTAPIFPLAAPVPLLKSFHLTSPSTSQSIYDLSPINLTLFTPSSFSSLSHLESLHINIPQARLADLYLFATLIPSLPSLKHLTLRAYISHTETFSFIRSLCSDHLDSLDLELIKDDVEAFMLDHGMGGGDDVPAMGMEGVLNGSLEDLGLNPTLHAQQQQSKSKLNESASYIEGLYLPSLKSLTLHGPSATMLSSVIDAPKLEELRFDVRGEDGMFSLGYALAAASGLAVEEDVDIDVGLDGEGEQQRMVDNMSGTPLYTHLKHLTISGDGDDMGFLYVPSEMIRLFVSGGMHEELQSLTLGKWGNLTEVLEMLGKPDGRLGRVDTPSLPEDSHLDNSAMRTLPSKLNSITILPSPITSTLSSMVPDFVSEYSESLSSTIDSLFNVNNGLVVDWNQVQELGAHAINGVDGYDEF